MMVAPTLPMFERLMRPAWERVCPPELIVSVNEEDRCYTLLGGLRVWWGSAWNPDTLQGTNLGSFWGDEIRYWPRDAWTAMESRLRDKRAIRPQGIATSTPALGWMDELFNRGLPDHKPIRIKTSENAHNLAPGYIESLHRVYTERQVRALLEGEFLAVENQVFSSFDPEKHLIDWNVDWRFGFTVWMDFGYRHSSVLFAQHTGDFPMCAPGGLWLPPKSTIIVDELQPERLATEAIIPAIREVLHKHGLDQPTWIFCDPAGQQHDVSTGMPAVERLRSAFGNIVHWQEDRQHRYIPNGIMAVEGMFAPMEGKPRLYIHRRLAQPRHRTPQQDFSRGLIPMLQRYSYPQGKSGAVQTDHPEKDGVLDHCADALRYGVVNTTVIVNRESLGQNIVWINYR
jgi:hypothetical protein